MGIETRSKSSNKDMSLSLSDEIKNYLDNLVKPLMTQDSFKKALDEFKEEVVDNFTKIIEAQNKKIEELEDKISIQSKKIAKLEVANDDQEQFSRRYCLRVHGIQYEGNDDNDVMEKVKTCYKETNLTLKPDDIDRAHFVGKDFVNKQNKKVRSIIIRFRSWNSRLAFYRARPKFVSKKKPDINPSKFSVSIDLTKRRYNLLKVAKEKIKNNPHVDYAFSDVNCSLAIK